MAGIHEDRLVKRESDVASVQGGIRRGVESSQRRLGQARDKLLYITDALRCGSRAARTIAVPESEI